MDGIDCNRIGDLLYLIDLKIEKNNQVYDKLEKLAKKIYSYWFVQFDYPDENNKPYKSSGGKMVWDESIETNIPIGWKVEKTSDFIEVIRGVSYDTDDISDKPQEGYIPLLKSNNLQNDRLLLEDVIYVSKKNVSDEQFLDNNSIFVTMSSGSTEHVGKTAVICYDTAYTFGAFCSKIVIKPQYRCFISLFFLSEYFKKKIRTIVVGTSIKNINNAHLTENLIPVPDEKILRRFESMVNPVLNKQGEITRENQKLVSMRKYLLPLLMNGQVGFRKE